MVKNLPAMQETRVRFLSWEDPLEKGKATHPTILAWKTAWTDGPGGLRSMGRVESDVTEQLIPPLIRLEKKEIGQGGASLVTYC